MCGRLMVVVVVVGCGRQGGWRVFKRDTASVSQLARLSRLTEVLVMYLSHGGTGVT